jgi:hypothetical protein
MGTSHAVSGQPCQDASYCRVVNGSMLVAAVADGAGSARHSAIGSRIAARTAVEIVADNAAQFGPSTDVKQWHRLLLAAAQTARGHIEASAVAHGAQPQDFATTLLLFAAMPDLIIASQIGDGAIVLRDRAGTVRALTLPRGGEYANTTTFLVSPNAFNSVQAETWRGPYTEIAAFTDGLQRLALTMPSGTPHAPFFVPLFDVALGAEDSRLATAELSDFLRSEKVAERADDDLTLMLVKAAS